MILKKLTEEEYDSRYYESIGCHADNAYEIILHGIVMGIILISDCNPHFGDVCTFIEWVDISPSCRVKGLFSRVISEVFSLYKTDELHFESNEDKLPMYLHMGAKKRGISELTENHMLVLSLKNFNERNAQKGVKYAI